MKLLKIHSSPNLRKKWYLLDFSLEEHTTSKNLNTKQGVSLNVKHFESTAIIFFSGETIVSISDVFDEGEFGGINNLTYLFHF